VNISTTKTDILKKINKNTKQDLKNQTTSVKIVASATFTKEFPYAETGTIHPSLLGLYLSDCFHQADGCSL
jgi:hypothetical protein